MTLKYGVLAITLLSLNLSAPLSARSVPETWFHWLDQAERALESQEWNSAYKKAEKVSRGAMRHLRGGAGAEELLARIFVTQAVAEAGRGNERLARWNWDAALELHPPMEKLRLDSYGEAGRLLREDTELEDKQQDSAENATERSVEDQYDDVVAPRKTYAPRPDFPRGRLDKQGLIIVQVIIDQEGQVSSPHVLEDQDEPLMVYATLKAMRDWTFEPATLDGESVDVYYNLSVRFN